MMRVPYNQNFTWLPGTAVVGGDGQVVPQYDTQIQVPGRLQGYTFFGPPIPDWKPRPPRPGDRITNPLALRPVDYRVETVEVYSGHIELTLADLNEVQAG